MIDAVKELRGRNWLASLSLLVKYQSSPIKSMVSLGEVAEKESKLLSLKIALDPDCRETTSEALEPSSPLSSEGREELMEESTVDVRSVEGSFLSWRMATQRCRISPLYRMKMTVFKIPFERPHIVLRP